MNPRQRLEAAEQALRIADHMVAMEPARAVPWLSRSLALSVLTRYSEALVAVEQAIEIDPSDPDKWDLKVSILRQLVRPRDADSADRVAKNLRKQ